MARRNELADAAQKPEREKVASETAAEIYTEVKEHIEKEEYEDALKLCKKLPLDETSGGCRLFCLLQLGRCRVALDVLKSLRATLQHQPQHKEDFFPFSFEEAYCLYRTNQPKKALHALQQFEQQQQQQGGGRGATEENEKARLVHLKAQILHRLGDYEKAKEIYEELLKDDCDNELLLVNYLSATVCADALRQTSALNSTASKERLLPDWVRMRVEQQLCSSYELPYNAACAALQEGHFIEAHKLLLRAKSLCLAESNLSAKTGEDEEKARLLLEELRQQGDLAAVYVQLGYLAGERKDVGSALEFYGAVLERLNEQQQQHKKQQQLRGAVSSFSTNSGMLETNSSISTGDEEKIDAAAAVIAQNNSIILQQAANNKEINSTASISLEEAIARLALELGEPFEPKLTKTQAYQLAVNRCASLVQAKRKEEAHRAISASIAKYGNQSELLLLQISMQLCGGGKLSKAEQQLCAAAASALKENLSVNSIRLLLAAAILRFEQQDVSGAIDLLTQAQQQQQLLQQRQVEQLQEEQLRMFGSGSPEASATLSQDCLELKKKSEKEQQIFQQQQQQLLLQQEMLVLMRRAGHFQGVIQVLQAQLQTIRLFEPFYNCTEEAKAAAAVSGGELLLNLGAAYGSLSKWEEALKYYQEAAARLSSAAATLRSSRPTSTTLTASSHFSDNSNSSSSGNTCFIGTSVSAGVYYMRAISGAIDAASRLGSRRPLLLLAPTAGAVLLSSCNKASSSSSSFTSSSTKSTSHSSSNNSVSSRLFLMGELRQHLPQHVLLLDGEEVERQDLSGVSSLLNSHTACNKEDITNTTRKKPKAAVATTTIASAGQQVQAVEQGEKTKKLRKKRPRWPKNFDPSQPHLPPDPERWLPKCERAGYKKMLRRRKEAGRGGAQGAALAGSAEATTGFRDQGPSTARIEAARDHTVGSRKKRAARK